MSDLFDFTLPAYPIGAGFKGRATSREAAESIQPQMSRLEQIVIDTIRDNGPLTADQCAAVSGIDKLSIRPRCSMLGDEKRPGGPKLRDTGERRLNASGKRAVVWALA